VKKNPVSKTRRKGVLKGMLDTSSISTQQFQDPQDRIMPIVRRKRAHLSSTRVNQIEAQGLAHLCFAEDHSWFQGNINTDDESNYSLYGERVKCPSATNITVEQNNNEIKVEEDLSTNKDYYRVTLTDHFTGLSYTLPKIAVNTNVNDTDNRLFCCTDGQMRFKVENVFKGQKADMIIQRYLGSSTLLGRKCLVYSGDLYIVFNEVIDTGRIWSL
jgi:hypothetical protein